MSLIQNRRQANFAAALMVQPSCTLNSTGITTFSDVAFPMITPPKTKLVTEPVTRFYNGWVN